MTEPRIFPKMAIILTEKVALHITIDSFTNRDTGIIEHYSVNIGSRKSKCIHLIVPGNLSGVLEGKLNWVAKIVPECYLTAKDKTKLSQHIVNLAFTIARDINPRCTRYLLNDCSSFPCSLPNGTTQVVPMKPFHIAFHGSTWYEYYFGARLEHNHEIYERLKLNLYDSSKKTPKFEFNHPDLEEILKPMYDSTETWWNFFQAIQAKYGDKKCSVVYPWIRDAMFEIFDHSNIYEVHKWYIDLDKNVKDAKTPIIPFHTYEDIQTGGKRKFTKKQKTKIKTKTNEFLFNIPPVFIEKYYDIQSMNYKKFLK